MLESTARRAFHLRAEGAAEREGRSYRRAGARQAGLGLHARNATNRVLGHVSVLLRDRHALHALRVLHFCNRFVAVVEAQRHFRIARNHGFCLVFQYPHKVRDVLFLFGQLLPDGAPRCRGRAPSAAMWRCGLWTGFCLAGRHAHLVEVLVGGSSHQQSIQLLLVLQVFFLPPKLSGVHARRCPGHFDNIRGALRFSLLFVR
mmetsp:Transcript_13609/g.33470  ORF Transcript_13609/g.33470 Transcript_13609/m.33470 type:complete len:202 (-) Transcript_13609:1717-2322(-)